MIFSMILSVALLSQTPGTGGRLYYNLRNLKTVKGVVVAVHDSTWPLTMDVVSGKDTLEVLLGPPFGVSWLPAKGDSVEVYGSVSGRVMIAGWVTDKVSGKKLVLRDSNGFPVWRGHGYKQRRGRRGRR